MEWIVNLKVKLSVQQAVEIHEVVRRPGFHIFQTIGSHMAARLLALRPDPLNPQNDPGTDFC
jgi:hypothetical protein